MIVVTGATGNVGGELARQLAARGEGVRAVVRDPSSARVAAGLGAAGVTPVAGDLNQPESLRAAFEGARGLFLLPGYPEGIVDEAKTAGVERIVLLSGGSAVASDTANAVSEYMIASERAVRASGLAWTFLRPVSFMSNTLEWAAQLAVGDTVLAPFAGVPIATIDPADIAAVAAVALTADGHDGAAYALTGPEALRPADRLALLGTALGRALTLVPESDEEAWARMTAAMPEKYVRAFFSFFVDGTLDETTVTPTVEQVTGRAPRSFAQWARAHVDAFR